MKRAASRPCLALLPAGVTWPPALLRTPVVSYTTFSPSPSPPVPLPEGEERGGKAVCFCGPDPAGCPVPGFPRRRALWSADFPRSLAFARDTSFACARDRDRPASLKTKVSYRLCSGESISDELNRMAFSKSECPAKHASDSRPRAGEKEDFGVLAGGFATRPYPKPQL